MVSICYDIVWVVAMVTGRCIIHLGHPARRVLLTTFTLLDRNGLI